MFKIRRRILCQVYLLQLIGASSLYQYTMWWKMMTFSVVFFYILANVAAKPFFFNSTGFITSLLGASSSPVLSSSSIHPFEENPLSENIALILPNEHEKESNNEDGSKNKRDDDNFIFPDDLGTFRTTTTPSSIVFDTTPSVTSPKTSFIQKKVQKIINKIITISQIKNAIENSLRDRDEPYPNYYNPDDGDSNSPNVSMYTRRPNLADYTRSKIAIKVEKKPDQEYGSPVKFDLRPNNNENIELEKEPEPLQEDNENASSGSSDRSGPAALGIFVLEMFASLVGLTLGAAAQINNSFGQVNNTV